VGVEFLLFDGQKIVEKGNYLGMVTAAVWHMCTVSAKALCRQYPRWFDYCINGAVCLSSHFARVWACIYHPGNGRPDAQGTNASR
jgi:hypothetical protein